MDLAKRQKRSVLSAIEYFQENISGVEIMAFLSQDVLNVLDIIRQKPLGMWHERPIFAKKEKNIIEKRHLNEVTGMLLILKDMNDYLKSRAAFARYAVASKPVKDSNILI